jgi:hypothetical protein
MPAGAARQRTSAGVERSTKMNITTERTDASPVARVWITDDNIATTKAPNQQEALCA